jgi:hypothetical protein
MDDLGAAEAPPEGAPPSTSSKPTSTSTSTTTMLVSPPPTGEKENADPLQVCWEVESNSHRWGHDLISSSH